MIFMLQSLRASLAGKPGASDDLDVDPAAALQAHRRGAILLDVREPGEWQSGHAPGARLIPLGQLSHCAGELPRDREIVAVCRSGNRSSVAAGLLRRAGFTQVKNLRGGMIAWANQGLPIER
jgi:rhodanese-related sulfurtransferase